MVLEAATAAGSAPARRGAGPAPKQTTMSRHHHGQDLSILGRRWALGRTTGENMYIVIVGANDGRAPDPVYLLYASGASGVLVEVESLVDEGYLQGAAGERAVGAGREGGGRG